MLTLVWQFLHDGLAASFRDEAASSTDKVPAAGHDRF
jgi:hypothetical protein